MISKLLFIPLGIVAIFFYWYYRRQSAFFRHFKRIPFAPNYPLVGTLPFMPKETTARLQTIFIDWVKKYGRMFCIWRGSIPIVMVSAPEYAEVVLTSQKHLSKGTFYDGFVPWLGDGLLLSTGERWKKDRRMLTPTFHFHILDGFFDDFNRNATILNEVIESKMKTQKEINVNPLISACTLDIICEAAMGIQINAQLGGNEYTEALHEHMDLFQKRVTSIMGLAPLWLYKLTRNGRRYFQLLDKIQSFTANVLKEKKAARELKKTRENSCSNVGNDGALTENDSSMGLKKRKAFLDKLLDTAEETGDLSEKRMLNQVDTFMFAGHDTTSTALTWVLYCLATNPQEQDRVYEELMDVLEGSTVRPITMEDTNQLKYMECCMKESIRLFPSIVAIQRTLNEIARIGEHTLPAGITVAVSIYAIHHNEDHFPDPETFKPERFLPEQSAGRHPYAFIPFSAGPRNCIGQKYALYEEKVILASLLRNFQFRIDLARIPIQPLLDIVLKPSGGLPLMITKRPAV